MLFNSIDFIIFFLPITFLLYFFMLEKIIFICDKFFIFY